VLEEAFQRELGYRRRAVTAATDPARAFLQLCYVQLLYKDFDKLKDEPANA
jgi:hypothetical protein